MIIREAVYKDIPAIQVVRNTVRENQLSNPDLVTDADCEDYMFSRGKGWVCDMDGCIVAFAIVSLTDNNVWALFVEPGFDKKGIGKRLHDSMLDWYFSQTDTALWLSTAPGTRAESFYRKAGWSETGVTKSGEIKFEMKDANWHKQSSIINF